MNRRGIALLVVLWLVAILATLGVTSVSLARTVGDTSRNRLMLTRAAWAREACAEIVLARYAADTTIVGVDTTEIGRGAWCAAKIEDPHSLLNANAAPTDMLTRVIANPLLSDALLDWRDPDDVPRRYGAERAWYASHGRALPRDGALASVQELRLIAGFDDSAVARLNGVLTVRGDGRLNPNTAPLAAVAALPGVGASALQVLYARRDSHRRIASLEEWASLMPTSARLDFQAEYAALAVATSFVVTDLILEVDGGVRGSPVISHATLTVIPAGRRLAVIRRELQ